MPINWSNGNKFALSTQLLHIYIYSTFQHIFVFPFRCQQQQEQTFLTLRQWILNICVWFVYQISVFHFSFLQSSSFIILYLCIKSIFSNALFHESLLRKKNLKKSQKIDNHILRDRNSFSDVNINLRKFSFQIFLFRPAQKWFMHKRIAKFLTFQQFIFITM